MYEKILHQWKRIERMVLNREYADDASLTGRVPKLKMSQDDHLGKNNWMVMVSA